MNPAVEPFKEALTGVKLRKPRIGVYSNVDGQAYVDAIDIAKKLPKQMVKCVKWEQTVKNLYRSNEYQESFYPQTIECGPGSGLNAMLTKLNGKAARRSAIVST